MPRVFNLSYKGLVWLQAFIPAKQKSHLIPLVKSVHLVPQSSVLPM